MASLYEFDLYLVKARTNAIKHGLDFEQAANVFMDPLATSPTEFGEEAHQVGNP